MKPGIEDVKAWYDDFVDSIKWYHDPDRQNGRFVRIKSVLGSIIKPGTDVLDLGCGTGITTHHIGLLGARVTGVDIADGMIEFAKGHSSNQNTSYMVEDVVDMRLEKTFDTVVMCDVLEHIRRDRIPDLMHTIDLHCGDTTNIYLNVPDGRYSRYALTNPQIIDEAWDMIEVLGLFKSIGFEPVSVGMYGLDVKMPQYNDYVFVKESVLVRGYGI